MIDYINYLKFNYRFNNAINSLPNHELINKYYKSYYRTLNQHKYEDISLNTLLKNLPLTSLKTMDTMPYIKVWYVSYDEKEYNRVVKNKNIIILRELRQIYFSIKNRNEYYKNNEVTLTLLLDMLNNNYHISHQNEFEEVCKYLIKNIKSYDSKSLEYNNCDLNDRLNFELEFIKRQNEKENC